MTDDEIRIAQAKRIQALTDVTVPGVEDGSIVTFMQFVYSFDLYEKIVGIITEDETEGGED